MLSPLLQLYNIMLSSSFAFLSLVLGLVGYVNASPLSSADSLTNVDPCT
jgi:hypothetical protein